MSGGSVEGNNGNNSASSSSLTSLHHAGPIMAGNTADSFLDTIPEDQAVAQQRLANLSASSAVAYSDSDNGATAAGYHPKPAKPGSAVSSGASDANALIEAGQGSDQSTAHSSSEAGKPGSSWFHTFYTSRWASFCTVVSLLAVGIAIGVYLILARAPVDPAPSGAPSESFVESNPKVPTPPPFEGFPPGFIIDLESEAPSPSPSFNQMDIEDVDIALLRISGSEDILDRETPQGRCRYWLTHTDLLELRVSEVGEDAILQRYILCVLYEATNGPDWILPAPQNSFRDPTLHECDWVGVSCDKSNVAVLYLVGLNLQGSIPQELGDLSTLQGLYFRDNGLKDDLPTSLFTLPELIWIDVAANLLTGTVPNPPDAQKAPLEILYLNDNTLTGFLPFFPTVEKLRVQENALEDWDSRYTRLQSLTKLEMYQNSFAGALPTFWDAPKLQVVDLALNDWTGTIPGSLWNLPALESLLIHDTQITGSLPESTVSNRFKYVWLFSNRLSGTFPLALGSSWENLSEFLLHNNTGLTGNIGQIQCQFWPALERLESDCERPNFTCFCCTACHGSNRRRLRS